MKKKFISSFGLVIMALASIGLVAHRFYNPDMTQVRWFIEFWYIWLAWFVSVILSLFMVKADNK